MARRPKKKQPLKVESLTHDEAGRTNIPTAEHQPLMKDEERHPIQVAYERRNPDLDPQLVWRGKDTSDWSELVTTAPPLYIQEKVQPKALIDDLRRSSEWRVKSGERGDGELHAQGSFADLFSDFNGLPEGADRTDFYQHEANWSNRMILGDSLSVMASLAEREGLRGKVQCIYIDPPYGIKFNSNFQWSTTSRDVKDGKAEHITREPEQVKAFRDTWRDGIHSYLTYLRDRLTVARDLLTDSGSIFVQIGDENVHRVRAVMDEVFGDDSFCALIPFQKTAGGSDTFISSDLDYLLWYARRREVVKYRPVLIPKDFRELRSYRYAVIDPFSQPRNMTIDEKNNPLTLKNMEGVIQVSFLGSQDPGKPEERMYPHEAKLYDIGAHRHWKTSNPIGLDRLSKSSRIVALGSQLNYKRYAEDGGYTRVGVLWNDVGSAGFSNVDPRVYVVQTDVNVLRRCLLMTTDPGDLVLDPTCGSGTTAYVAEQWGRRWITIDTSRVALALARARVMGARYPWYLLSDSPEGQTREAEVERRAPSESPTYGDIRQGFVYERVPHVTLRAIANNAEIDVIWANHQELLEPLRQQLNQVLETRWEEWQIPRDAEDGWPDSAKQLHADWWAWRIERQKEIDASIAAKADFDYLYDKPYQEKRTVRVAGPFTVESLSPHRMLGVDEHGELIDKAAEATGRYGEPQDFASMILDNLRTAGVQQAHKQDRIKFDSLTPWPGDHVCAEGRYTAASEEWRVKSDEQGSGELSPDHSPLTTAKRAGVFIGPEFGTVQRQDLVEAAREAADADFDLLIACAFNYEAHATEFDKLGRIPILKARMNADLHMAGELKNTGEGNLFVIFGEPDIAVASEEWLVDSSGKRIAPYEIFKLVSGTDRLAEVNRLSREDIQKHAQLSGRREVWDYLTDQAGRVFGSGEHRGGTGTTNDGGVSSVAWHCAGIAGGARNLSDFVQKAGTLDSGSFRHLIEQLRGDQQDAQRADQVTLHSPLTTRHLTQVTVRGVDVFDPSAGAVRSDDTDGIACWFIDTDYDSESFFVRHAYFLGANDPYKSLKRTLKAEIDAEAWATLRSDTSRPFDKPESGRIAVKVINHLGDEVMKVFKV